MLNKILILSFVLALMSCSDNGQKRKDIVAAKIEMMNENGAEWEDLTNDILNNTVVNQKLSKAISPSELDDELEQRLIEQGIVRISVQNSDSCKSVEYATNWTEYPVGTLYLKWTTCDSIQTQKGFYLDNLETNFIEVWGLGNNWLISIDSDFI